MTTSIRVGAALLFGAWLASPLSAADLYQRYRIVYDTVYEDREVTRYRLEYQTEVRERTITVRRPEWITEERSRRIRVRKPVIETSEREERRTVLRPITEVRYEERSYDRISYTNETEMRTVRRKVQRPVTETSEREERVVVRRPVTETVMQDYQYTQPESVTTLRTELVDQGGFVDRQVYRPGRSRVGLRWLPGGATVDPYTGTTSYYGGGLFWAPRTVTAPRVDVYRQYVPNVVARQVPQTSVVNRVVTAQRPVQVTRYVDEVETRRVPVRVQRMQEFEEVEEVPITVRKPVTERITYRVPIRTQRWEREEVVRKIPVTTRRYEYEDREEPYTVRVRRWVSEEKVERTPHTVAKWVPYQVVRRTPRRVAMRIPIDACGNPIEIVSPDETVIEEEATEVRRESPSNNKKQGDDKADESGKKGADKKPAISPERAKALKLLGANGEPAPKPPGKPQVD